jgi:HK97 gp10 family phage protein
VIDMKITGGKQVHDLLQQLPVEVETKIMRNALSAGVRVYRDEARNQVADTTDTGLLRKAIKTSRNTKRGRVIAKVKLKGKHSYAGLFLEFGVAAHAITVRDAEGSLKIGKNFVGAEVMHPGFSPKPFLRPSFDLKSKDAVNAVGAYIGKYLQFGSITAPTIAVDEEEA